MRVARPPQQQLSSIIFQQQLQNRPPINGGWQNQVSDNQRLAQTGSLCVNPPGLSPVRLVSKLSSLANNHTESAAPSWLCQRMTHILCCNMASILSGMPF